MSKPRPKKETQYQIAIGKFIMAFSQLEYSVKSQFCFMFGEYKDDIGSFVDHVDTLKVFDGILAVIEQRKNISPTEKTRLEKALREFRKINDARVKIVHGLWSPDLDGNFSLIKPHKNPKNKEGSQYYEDIKELEKLTSRCNENMKMVLGLNK